MLWIFTDREFGAFAALSKPSPKIDHYTSKHNVLLFDLELRPTTLTHNPSLAKVNVDIHAKIKVKE